METETIPPIIHKKAVEWHVLYTAPRAEKRVLERLILQGIESYLPLHRVPRVWSDRVKNVDIPLISSYVFVRCRECDAMQLVHISGVVRVVYHEGKPAIVRQSEIDAIREFLAVASGKELIVGEAVEILTGSMKKRTGEIVKIKKKYIYLYIEQLHATVCVAADNVAAADRLK